MTMVLSKLHIKLLRSGEDGRWISLSDDQGVRAAELIALEELHIVGFVEHAKGPFPPGPPSFPPSIITDAGREALWKVIGRPVPPHGAGP